MRKITIPNLPQPDPIAELQRLVDRYNSHECEMATPDNIRRIRYEREVIEKFVQELHRDGIDVEVHLKTYGYQETHSNTTNHTI